MIYLWATGLAVANLLWLALNLLTLPGNWLIVASTVLVAWANRQAGMFSIWTLLAVFALAVAGEAVELLAAVVGGKRAGAGARGMWGALLGGFVGAVAGTFLIPIPALGALIGACLGACLGAWALELTGGRNMKASLRAGLGSGAGRLLGTAGKLTIGAVMWFIVAIAAFWP